MGWFWADSCCPATTKPEQPSKLATYFWTPRNDVWLTTYEFESCPVKGAQPKPAASCPVRSGTVSNDAAVAPAASSGCPVNHSALSSLNNMPHNISSARLPGQKTALPTERTMSVIPKGEKPGDGFWEYPSPQQMLAAMVRKDKNAGIESDIDETAVESMVGVHNFLNDGVWEEVLEWEKPYSEASRIKPRLLKFQGRPGELSPRARLLQLLGKVAPAKFGVPPPFDRHDWTVLRAIPTQSADGAAQDVQWQEIRYVIDFYEIPGDAGEDPIFTVDVRPALDSINSVKDRIKAASASYTQPPKS